MTVRGASTSDRRSTRSGLAEELSPSRLADRHHGGMLQPTLYRDGVEATAHRIGAPHQLGAMQSCQVSFQDRRNGKDAFSGPAELPEKLRIVKFAEDVRPDVQAVEPLVDASSDRG